MYQFCLGHKLKMKAVIKTKIKLTFNFSKHLTIGFILMKTLLWVKTDQLRYMYIYSNKILKRHFLTFAMETSPQSILWIMGGGWGWFGNRIFLIEFQKQQICRITQSYMAKFDVYKIFVLEQNNGLFSWQYWKSFIYFKFKYRRYWKIFG